MANNLESEQEKTEVLSLHSKQGKIFLSDTKITLACSGIQGGKSTVGSLWLARQISRQGKKNYIIGAPTFRILNQSTMPAFLKNCGTLGSYHRGDQEFHLKNGGRIYIRTSTDPESVEGITDVGAIWLDEAGKCKYRFWVNLEGRAARTNAPICLTTTPYALNWVHKELIKPHNEKKRNDIHYEQWTSLDNPSFPKSEYERQEQILDAVTFSMKYGGLHARRLGLVHPLDDGHIIEPFRLPHEAKYYAGIDWGFTNPMAIIVRAMLPDGRDIQVAEFYESGVYPDDIVRLIKQKHDFYKFQAIVADPEDPGKISMCQKYGLPVLAGNNKDNSGVDAHNQIMRSGRFAIFNTCKHTIDEYETYHWPEKEDDLNKDVKDKPVKKDDHTMNANQYLSYYFVITNIHMNQRPGVHRLDQVKIEREYVAPWDRKKVNQKRPEEL